MRTGTAHERRPEDYLDDLGKLFVDNLKLYRTGEPLQNVVDKELGFVSAS